MACKGLGASGSWQHEQTWERVFWPSVIVGIVCEVLFVRVGSAAVSGSWPKRDLKVSES